MWAMDPDRSWRAPGQRTAGVANDELLLVEVIAEA
jgi:hypothetical protein